MLAVREHSRGAVLRCSLAVGVRRSGASFCAHAGSLDRRLCMLAPNRRLPSCLVPVIILDALRPCRSEYLLDNCPPVQQHLGDRAFLGLPTTTAVGRVSVNPVLAGV
jgi:hypothetical protein